MVSFIKVLNKRYASTEPVEMRPQAPTLSIYALRIIDTRGDTNDC